MKAEHVQDTHSKVISNEGKVSQRQEQMVKTVEKYLKLKISAPIKYIYIYE